MTGQLTVAVIGSGGFIGRHLALALQSRPVTLRLFSRKAALQNSLQSVSIDLGDRAAIAQALHGVDVAYYLVSETIPSTSWDDPHREVERNLLPFLDFMEGACEAGVRKVSFISSAGTVYGPTSGKVNEDALKAPFSPYGIIKLAMENFLSYYSARNGVNYDVFRVSNVYGEGQDTSKGLGIINTFIEHILRQGKVTVFGDGSATRNYIYAADVARLLCLSVERPDDSGIYNIASDDTCSINHLVEVMREVIPRDFTVERAGGRKSDNSYVDFDNTRILSSFPGFRFTPLKQAILKTYIHLEQEFLRSSHEETGNRQAGDARR